MFSFSKLSAPITALIIAIKLCTGRSRLNISISILLSLICSFAEVLTIALLVPFINSIFAYNAPNKISLLSFDIPHNLIFLYPFVMFVSTSLRLLSLHFNFWLGASLGNYLSTLAYHNMISQRYSYYQQVKSSSVITSLSVKSNMLSHSLNQLFQLITTSLVTSGLLIALFVIDLPIAFILLTILLASYFLISFFSYKAISRDSKIISSNLDLQSKLVIESFGSIRDIILNNTFSYYKTLYQKIDSLIRDAEARNQLLTFVPRYLMEAIGLTTLLIISLYLKFISGLDSGKTIAIVAAFALALQRLMPSLQNVYSSLTQILAHKEGVADFLHFLRLDLPQNYPFDASLDHKMILRNSISLINVTFAYTANQVLFENVNLSIPKGSRVGVIGTTGAGKSTFFDLLLGLRQPTAGHILVDDNILSDSNICSYQKSISHVPQNIYLTSDSFTNNIAFGESKPNLARIKKVCKMSRISDYIESLPEQYNTSVGENGSLLSGGQRQRIAIARALYKASSILFLDEFTSALDSTTEAEIVSTIASLPNEITVFLIAHRSASLSACNIILECSNSTIRRIK